MYFVLHIKEHVFLQYLHSHKSITKSATQTQVVELVRM
jgi:hypothetical protein